MKNYVEPEWSTVDHMLDKLDLEEEKRTKKLEKKYHEEANDGEDYAVEENLEDDDESGEEIKNESTCKNELSNVVYHEEDSDFDESLFCVACNKSFKSAKSFENHEKSKKHKDNVEILKKHMSEEDASLFLDNSEQQHNEINEEKSTDKPSPSANQEKQK